MINRIIFNVILTLALLAPIAQPVGAASPQDIVCKNLPNSEQCREAGGDNDTSTLDKYLDRLVKPVVYLAGVAAVIMLMIGGARFVLSSGDQEAVAGARRTITYALIGLLVVILAYAIVEFFLKKVF